MSNNRNHNSCPNCGVIFNPVPKRKTTCNSCNIEIYLRTKQTLFNSDILTEDQAKSSDFFDELEYIGATKDQYYEMQKKLTEKWGFVAKPYDIIWGLSNRLVTTVGEGRNIESTLQAFEMIYMAQANFLASRNIDPYTSRFLMNEMELQKIDYMGDLVSGVEIITANCCLNCEKIKVKTGSVESFKTSKTLPFKECTRKLNPKHKFSWCICYYSPMIKTFKEMKYR